MLIAFSIIPFINFDMKKIQLRYGLLIGVMLAVCFSSCPGPGTKVTDNNPPKDSTASGTLEPGEPGAGSLDKIYPQTPEGEFLKAHIATAMGHGENAEEEYQNSLRKLRENPEMPSVIFETYKQVPEDQYFLRTMLVETLKECRNPGGLKFLQDIASLPIQGDRLKEDDGRDTRQDEEIIRIIAIEGISLLAAEKNREAEEALNGYFTNENLSIRQMAVRGYLAYGDFESKAQRLKKIVPENEHWYIAAPTDIRQVEHPEMPEKFDIQPNSNSESPKIKGN